MSQAAAQFHNILRGSDRLLVVIGPYSIHDTKAAKEYAGRLLGIREELSGELEKVVMRVYFENRAPPWAGKA
ncbi:hypothetical protein M8494_37895 [Serratia ureilytica]